MPLTALTFEERRRINLTAMKAQLDQFERYSNGVIRDMFKSGHINSPNLDRIVDYNYGYPKSNDDNEEYEVARILTLAYFVGQWVRASGLIYFDDKTRAINLVQSIKERLNLMFTDYKFQFYEDSFPKYERIEFAAVVDNIKQIKEDDAELVISLLRPFTSVLEIKGLLGTINSRIEKWKKDDVDKLNTTDQSIFEAALKLSKQIINNVDGAKGHAGESELSVKDIAHNYALNVSLVFKLKEINDKKPK